MDTVSCDGSQVSMDWRMCCTLGKKILGGLLIQAIRKEAYCSMVTGVFWRKVLYYGIEVAVAMHVRVCCKHGGSIFHRADLQQEADGCCGRLLLIEQVLKLLMTQVL